VRSGTESRKRRSQERSEFGLTPSIAAAALVRIAGAMTEAVNSSAVRAGQPAQRSLHVQDRVRRQETLSECRRRGTTSAPGPAARTMRSGRRSARRIRRRRPDDELTRRDRAARAVDVVDRPQEGVVGPTLHVSRLEELADEAVDRLGLVEAQ